MQKCDELIRTRKNRRSAEPITAEKLQPREEKITLLMVLRNMLQ